jgi:hypothetical protein
MSEKISSAHHLPHQFIISAQSVSSTAELPGTQLERTFIKIIMNFSGNVTGLQLQLLKRCGDDDIIISQNTMIAQ